MSQVAKEIVPLAKQTWADFQRHNGQWLAAAIAYFTLFAVAPLIIVVAQIVALFLGQHQDVLGQLYAYLAHNAGRSAASGIRSIVNASMTQHRAGAIAQIAGWAVFVLAAIGLFNSLQQALNIVWDIEPKKQSIWAVIQSRALSFGVVIAIAFVLLVSLGINALLTIAGNFLANIVPFFPTLLKVLDFIISFGIITAVFALLFEYLPECRIEWRDVWPGAAFTSLLFVVGQFLLGWYLGRAGISSTYGAFGGLVVFLVWVNYSAQIMLLGAEFTHVYARRFGSRRTQTTHGEIDTRRTATTAS
jgi:membrane protein